MLVAVNQSLITKEDPRIDYWTADSLLIQQNLIFGTALIFKIYEYLTCFILLFVIGA